jgi:1-acyl-sn-glycerol-3-phosphate acyltransferase
MRRLFSGLISTIIKALLLCLCRIDYREMAKLPLTGPCLFVMNHVSFIEVPIVYLFLRPRKLYSLVKEETWKNPFLAYLADIWNAIPIRRGTADFTAFGAAENVFRNGNIIIMAPEGTRSGDGILRPAHGGAVLLAIRNKVPVYPIAHTGGELFLRRFRRFRRTDFRIRVGRPFYVDITDSTAHLPSSLRREITGEIMGRIAELLPDNQRGAYADAARKSPVHLRYADE